MNFRLSTLDYDYWVFTNQQWLARGEGVLRGAEFIIAFENQLVDILNYTGPAEIEDELQDLAGGFGYYFEIGNVWNIGFYSADDWAPLPPAGTPYSHLLMDPRWMAKRDRIIRRSVGQCESCSGSGHSLEVHHCYYRYGRMPWQYPDAALLALCRGCHEERAKIELRWRSFMPRFPNGELERLQKSLDAYLYWYDHDDVLEFLASFGRGEADLHDCLDKLLKKRCHPEDRTSDRRL